MYNFTWFGGKVWPPFRRFVPAVWFTFRSYFGTLYLWRITSQSNDETTVQRNY